MTFDRPILLFGLVALPILWLLARVVWQRREVGVSSLFIWRKLGLEAEAPREFRRRADRLLLLRLAIALLAVLGAAGLRLGPNPPPPELHLVVDDSLSMGAFEDGVTRGLAAVREALPEDAVVVESRSPDLSGLNAALARSPEGEVVYVTDHPLPEEMDRVRVVLVGEPVENVGFASAWLAKSPELRLTVVVRNYGTAPRSVELVAGEESERFDLVPGEAKRISLPASPGRVTAALRPGDRFDFDDAVEVRWDEGDRIALAWVGPESPRLALALRLAGIDLEADATGSIAYRSPAGDGTRILIAPPGDRRAAGPVTGVGEGISPESVPGADVPLGPAQELAPGGRPLLTDRDGDLAVLRGDRVEVALDPGDPASAWSMDPSFPIFWSDIGRLLGRRPPESVLVTELDPEESATRAAGGVPDLTGLTPSRAGGDRTGTSLLPLLCLAAAALLVLHVLLEARGRT